LRDASWIREQLVTRAVDAVDNRDVLRRYVAPGYTLTVVTERDAQGRIVAIERLTRAMS
jgi:hypothetical protein